LSPVQADAIAGAADRASEQRLVALAARTNITELRDECLRTKVAADRDGGATHRRIHAARHVRTYTDGEGAWVMTARGTAEAGGRIEAALARLVDREFAAARQEDRREPREAYAFDALVALAGGSGEKDGGGRTNPRYLALLRLDLAAAVRGYSEPGEVCEIAGIGPVPAGVARELLGQSVLKLVLTKGQDVANVVHLGRGPTAAQRIALLWASPKCTNERCSSTLVQIDHRRPWADTKQTVLQELDPLCPHDHRLKTHAGWALVPGNGRRAFVPPSDPRHPRNRLPP
jgi:hypothetical protein